MAATKESIEVLKEIERDAWDRYDEAKERRKDAEKSFHLNRLGLADGDMIRETRQGGDVVYFFSSIDSNGWISGRKKLKDGSQGAVEARIYGKWERIANG